MALSPLSSNADTDTGLPTAPNGTTDSTAALYPRRSRRVLLLMFLAVLSCIVGASFLLRMLVAQRIPELTGKKLEEAQNLWDSAGPAGYEMDLEILRGRPGTVHIEVRNGEITAMARDGRTPAQHTWRYWSVPGLFETVERELEMAEDPVHEVGAAAGTRWKLRCEFDPAYGFPRRFHRHVSGGGQEVYWRVTSFVPK
jgi:Family of unknown function (DUF6174)